jgi:hypothetical protein
MFRILAVTVAVGCSTATPASTDKPADPAAATATAHSPVAAGANAGPRRSSIDCAAVLKGTLAASKTVYKPGTWGKLPAELQVVPPGAELCGGGGPAGREDDNPRVLIRSPIFGPALGEFYTPILTRMGCTMNPFTVVGSGDLQSTRGHFKCPGGKVGDIGTDTGSEFYFLSMYW